MNVPFSIDQINEVLKYLDEMPHKYAKPLVDFFKNHVENHFKAQQETANTDYEKAQNQNKPLDVANPQLQDAINQAQANSDSMANE